MTQRPIPSKRHRLHNSAAGRCLKTTTSSIYSHAVALIDNAPSTQSYAAAPIDNGRTASHHIGNIKLHSLFTPGFTRASYRVPDPGAGTDPGKRAGRPALPPLLPNSPTAKGCAPTFSPSDAASERGLQGRPDHMVRHTSLSRRRHASSTASTAAAAAPPSAAAASAAATVATP